MKFLKQFSWAIFFFAIHAFGQSKVATNSFKKVCISSHIQVELVQGKESSCTILENTEATEKLNVIIEDGVLEMYLEGARTNFKGKRNKKPKNDPYEGTIVRAKITFNTLEELSMTGEEKVKFTSTLEEDKLKVNLFGDVGLSFEKVNLKSFEGNFFGKNEVKFISGAIQKQKYNTFGKTTIEALSIKSNVIKISNFGKSSFKVYAIEKIRVTNFGETVIRHKGKVKPKVTSFGKVDIRAIQ